MSTFVFVHAAFHTSWAWEGVKTELERKGHTVIAEDLPGHGKNKRAVAEITMDTYVDAVKEWVKRAGEPVILAGNSMGGGIISLVAEAIPEKIQKLVYVAAFMPPNGKTIMDIAAADEKAEFLPNIEMSEDQSHCFFRKEDGLRERLMYADLSGERAREAVSHLMENQATQPFMVPMKLSDEGYGRIPRYYVECTEDRVLSHGMQRKLQEALPCKKTAVLKLPHIPHVSDPRKTAEALMSFL